MVPLASTSSSADPGAKSGVTDHLGRQLPEALTGAFKPFGQGLTDKQLSVRVGNNPILDLCLRISTYSVGRNGRFCYDPKRYGINVSGPQRLYQMIGRPVGKPTFRRMVAASSQQWKFVEECWIANMHTVIMNRMYDPVTRDRKLFASIRRYKIWFLRFFFSGRIVRKTRRDGKSFLKFEPSNFVKGLKALKAIAGWLLWSSTSDHRDINASPPPIPYWRGWCSQNTTLELVWFGGHLDRWRTVLIRTDHSDADIASLVQIRTFGRALPCPTQSMCESTFKQQLKVLSEPRETNTQALECIRSFAGALGRKLGVAQMPRDTHISVSTSGCFERSEREFGLAGEVSSWVKILDQPLSTVFISQPTVVGSEPVSIETFISGSDDYHRVVDVYGDKLFPRPRNFYRASRGFSRDKSKLTFLDYLFGVEGMSTRRRLVSKYVGDKPLPTSLGRTILWLASAKALSQGAFYRRDILIEPFYEIVIGDHRFPAYSSVQMEFHLVYKPRVCPMTQLLCLAEPGAKTRPLGKNQAWFTIVTRAMRFMAEPIIARDGRARIGLRSTNKMWSFLKFIQNSSYEFDETPLLQSSDYEAATDFIPLDILRAIWEGFLSDVSKTHPFWVYYNLIGCQRLMFAAPRFARLGLLPSCGRLNERGSFMGEPMSFLTLTLVNLLCEEISSAHYLGRWQQPLSQTYSGTLPGEPVCICGDDVAAVRRDIRRVAVFKETAIAMGMKLSWKDATSCRVLIFCEDHALVLTEGTSRGKVKYVDVIKSRLLTTMGREHSDNRSAILGKGRMLSNQLDYFEEKYLKIAYICYFNTIFDRVYRGNISRCRNPVFLPPCAGGLGAPVVDSVMPEFMWPFVGYIFKVLEIEDFFDRYCQLEDLSSLNHRIKHGLSTERKRKINVLRSECARYKHSTDPNLERIDPNRIYDDKFVSSLLREVWEVEVPSDPYTSKFDWSALELEASRIGFRPFQSLSEEIERILNFQEFFTNNHVRNSRTFNDWNRSSGKFWKNKITKKNRKALHDLGRSKFTTIGSLERSIQRGFSGWIFVGESDIGFNLANSGPSLRVSLGKFPASSVEKIRGNREVPPEGPLEVWSPRRPVGGCKPPVP